MGKLQTFEVVFEGNNEVFKPGDAINGQARIVLTGEKGDIRGEMLIQSFFFGVVCFLHFEDSCRTLVKCA